MKVYLFTAWCCLNFVFAAAQDLNGFWEGRLQMSGCFPENHIELQIRIDRNDVIGDSYHYQDIYNFVKKKFQGRFDPHQKKIIISETMVSTWKIPQHCVICIKQYELVYSREGNVEKLSGNWTGHIQNSPVNCGPGTIVLTRIKESAFKEIPEIKVDTGTIQLDFYDNAEVDGDSITVLVNKKTVLSHQRLTAEAATAYIKVDFQNPFHEVEMIAENLGSIPPNTALLKITAGTKTYHLFLSSTETKSAMVRFVYESPKTGGGD